MMEFLAEYLVFLAKAITWVAAIAVVIGVVATTVRQQRNAQHDRLDVTSLNDHFTDLEETVADALDDDAARKRRAKARKAEEKAARKATKLGKADRRPHVFVIDFDGDLKASGTDALRQEITAIVQAAQGGDEVLLRLESSGGLVHGYGLAASQLARLREAGIRLTVAVDKVAASGGYMMAAVADHVCAAPFAVVGSIGVVAQLPNFHRLLQAHNVDFELHTAGDHKRTLTIFGENTDAGRQKFREELEEAHGLFKAFITRYRPQLDIDRVATGEHWFGTRAQELGLIDSIGTSDDFLLRARRDKSLIHLSYRPHRSLQDRLTSAVEGAWRGVITALRRDERSEWM